LKRFGLIVVAAIVAIVVPAQVFAWPFLSTPTPTPTPQKLIQINPNLIKNIQLVGTNTPTPIVTVTSTPTPTVTPTVTPSISPTEMVSVTATPTSTVTQVVTPTPTPPVKVNGFTKKDMLFAGLVVAIFVLLVVQGNWAKIKAWLHNRTA